MRAGELLVVTFLSATGLVACGDPDEAPCEDGETAECSCPGGVPGVQHCWDDDWGGCDCASSDGDADTDGGVEICDDGEDADVDADTEGPGVCDDGLYCNGAEVCDDGACVSGTAPALSDGVGCTEDLCDEGLDAVVHTPTDALCSGLDVAAACSVAGRLEETVGRCDAAADCRGVTRIVEDCPDPALHPVTYSCGVAEIRRQDPVCLPAGDGLPARCGYRDLPEEDCSGAIPSLHPYCDGSAATADLTWHFGAEPVCVPGGAFPECTYSEETAACTAPGPSCAAGVLTTSTPLCDDAMGCGVAAAGTSCPDAATTCISNVLNTYEPSCASATECGPPVETRTPCTLAPSCEANVYTEWSRAVCDAAAGICERTPARAQDCDALEDPPQCDPTGRPAVSAETCTCDPTYGCRCEWTSTDCPEGREDECDPGDPTGCAKLEYEPVCVEPATCTDYLRYSLDCCFFTGSPCVPNPAGPDDCV